uniref:Uncharacterized protein n=1 Tax=Lepeophtheirus salmonis TaxID=72036 RepID=A0A0K2V5V0_LEPSM
MADLNFIIRRKANQAKPQKRRVDSFLGWGILSNINSLLCLMIL